MAPPAAFDATGYRRRWNSSRRSVAASDAHSYEGPSSVDAKNSTTWRIATAAASIAWPCATPGTSMKVPRGIAAAAAVPAAGG